MIELIVITALALYGTKVTWQEGMIFERLKKWIDFRFAGIIETGGDNPPVVYLDAPRYKIARIFHKPLYGCPACMVSIWGNLIYWNYYNFTWNHATATMWPVFLFATCGLTWIFLTQFPFDD